MLARISTTMSASSLATKFGLLDFYTQVPYHHVMKEMHENQFEASHNTYKLQRICPTVVNNISKH